MSANELAITNFQPKQININSLLGTIGMIAAPALYLGSFFDTGHIRSENQYQIFASALGVIYLCGVAASAIAMRRLRVTGNGTGAAILFYVQIIGLLLAMSWDVLEYAAPHLRQSTLYFIADMSYPFSHVLMTVVGFAVWRAGVWTGWRVIPAFLCGLALPLFFLSGALVGWNNSGWIFICGTISGFFMLGRAVVQSTKLPSKA
jgi:hypothetical protein